MVRPVDRLQFRHCVPDGPARLTDQRRDGVPIQNRSGLSSGPQVDTACPRPCITGVIPSGAAPHSASNCVALRELIGALAKVMVVDHRAARRLEAALNVHFQWTRAGWVRASEGQPSLPALKPVACTMRRSPGRDLARGSCRSDTCRRRPHRKATDRMNHFVALIPAAGRSEARGLLATPVQHGACACKPGPALDPAAAPVSRADRGGGACARRARRAGETQS